MNKINELKKLIGNTPLIKIVYKINGNVKNAYFKLEWYNLTGSIKDRVALSIIEEAYQNGNLKPGQTIVETTSGNMGISFSAIGKYLGHKVVIFMPKFMSKERQELLKLYGAELHLTESFEEAFVKAKEYAKKYNGFLTLQFDNPSNTNAHFKTTAKEIAKKIKTPKCFVAGIGTSGTLMGVGSYLKKHFNSKVIAVEPKSSLILTSGKSQGEHKIQGLSDGLIPSLYKPEIVDKIISVTDEDAIAMAIKLSKELGLGVGISSGANMVASVLSNINNTISVFTDDSKKYISTDLTKNFTTPFVDSIELCYYKVI